MCSICHLSGHTKNNKKFHPIQITREEAEKSANEWVGTGESIMRTYLIEAIMNNEKHKEIGKVLAHVVEIYVNKWLCEKSGRKIECFSGDSYDGKTIDDKNQVRNQIKFRTNVWHLETTRRNSKKNIKTNGTGHVAYRNNEFDVLVIFVPSKTFGITNSKIRCIPISALINPEKPDQLITRINSKLRKVYDCEEKTNEVIKEIYQI